ncbi:MAG TPA: nitrilase-related carbon-nitrogen hydrolase [Candidatus Polarisedimenticolaceae bacterium]|nr:nitrilase-related carbon-nitrogen hydrolase [Candidatus Polarisedimenticolaceae bacterium]
MNPCRVALAQIAPRLGDLGANLALHLEAIQRARRQGAGLVVFPELSLTGYLLRDDVPEVAVGIDDPRLSRLLRASRDIDVVLGLVEEAPGHRFHNAAAYLSGGRVLHVHRKVYLPTYGMFDEGRDFAAGDRFRAFAAPFGPAGLLVCEDAWHPSAPWLLAQEGAEVLFVLSSGPTRGARPKQKDVSSVAVWHQLLRTTAQFLTTFVVYVNRVGYEDGLNFGGGSIAVDPFGRELAALPALEPALAVTELDPEVLRRARTAYPLLRDEKLDLVRRELDRLLVRRYDLPGAEMEDVEARTLLEAPTPPATRPARRRAR